MYSETLKDVTKPRPPIFSKCVMIPVARLYFISCKNITAWGRLDRRLSNRDTEHNNNTPSFP